MAGELTQADLRERAAAQGTPVSERLITDWVTHGLLAPPVRRGLGRGKGSAATWSEEQAQLFMAALRARRSGTELAALANFSVFVWLMQGPGTVQDRQVVRALKTWSGGAGFSEKRAARRLAKHLVGQVAHSSAGPANVNALVDLLAQLAQTGQVDESLLLPVLRRVLQPGRVAARGPTEAPLQAELVWKILVARVTALTKLDALAAGELQRARLFYLSSREAYDRSLKRMDVSGVEELFKAPDANQLINSACLDLVTILGLLAREAAMLDKD